ncbi:wax ester/triacylglycerol synthase family O-acyltransferase [Antrihabitans cavernicola]|uniref:wax ester/triacylglycerol synthase family O-acyltransferase n=1 Tax=Antrihabitans cavernicola TaxID=2495913 RepID=UPI001659B35C|nr:wax ester/triacylglycerol synthase family O-acyltransferase [Spelaeibacter cavernicola]
MEKIAALDAAFLVGENDANPTHFSVLMVFDIPATAGENYVREVFERILANEDYHPVFRRVVRRMRGRPAWDSVAKPDIEHHLRFVTLPQPGGRDELLTVIVRSRARRLDRSRPLWEADIVDGMAGRRFAINLKIHHSLVDGIGFVRLVRDCLSTDPTADDCVAMWNTPRSATGFAKPSAAGPRHPLRAFGRDAGVIRAAARRDESLVMPYPHPIVGAGVTGSAHQTTVCSWEFERLDAIRRSVGDVSINDVLVAACGGALRSYLIGRGALPEASLKAMIPMATRTVDEAGDGGNAVGAIVADLGTDRRDPFERLRIVNASTNSGKALFRSIDARSALAWSAANMSPIYYNRFFGPRRTGRPRRFTTVVSNVPSSRDQLYFNGAALVEVHPIGLVTKGLDLNIALSNTARSVDFGVVTTIPDTQRFIDHYERALQDLER